MNLKDKRLEMPGKQRDERAHRKYFFGGGHREYNAGNKERSEDIDLFYYESAERGGSADVLCLRMLLGDILISIFNSYKQINVLSQL